MSKNDAGEKNAARNAKLKKQAEELRQRLTKGQFLDDGKISLGNGQLARAYEAGTIFYKGYAKAALPPEAQLQADLKEMIGIYEKYSPEYAVNDRKETSATGKSSALSHGMQKIFFGAPGTGKSWRIEHDLWGNKSGLENVREGRKFRTTFHPDYDYAQFVGAYKPMEKSGKITYSFVPQVFAKAYAKAWVLWLKNDEDKAKDKNVYLVIEEINRGNCAQIFGDIFQLLDRDSKGFSEYSINADRDFAGWLKAADEGVKSVWEMYKENVGEGKLKLPPNLNILATMNTSDQSLFPIDSAFKRRFDWEYVPIDFSGKDAANYKIRINDADGLMYSWESFATKVNAKILDLTESEDKQLGEFFIKPDKDNFIISRDRFLGKVMFYLWNEVCKDEYKNGSFFREGENGEHFTFQDLYGKEGESKLKNFMDWITQENTPSE